MMRLLLDSVMKKPATVRYPFVPVSMPDKFRGKILFHAEKCIGCKLCMRDCPSAAIEIRKVGEKQFEADIDCGKCIYCAQCVETCPKKALEATGDFELAQIDRAKLRTTQRGAPQSQPQPAAPAQSQGAPAKTP
jgi:formate hydrogenlyase subunit 6/NADH:ubiquinone oxidoreductase subunit I